METIKQALKTESTGLTKRSTFSPVRSTNSDGLVRVSGGFTASLYQGGTITRAFAATASATLKAAFPDLPGEFFQILATRAKENGFNDARLGAAINHVIDNCKFPRPKIADFIGFDEKLKLYAHGDVARMADEDREAFQKYKAIRYRDRKKPLWAHVDDIELYNLELWNKQD